MAAVHRVLVPDGQIFLQTDSKAYWDYTKVSLHNFSTLAKELGVGPIRLEAVPEEKFLRLSAE